MFLLLLPPALAQSAAPPPDGDALYTLFHTRVDEGDAARLVSYFGLADLPDGQYYSDLGAEGAGVCLAVRDDVVTRVYLHALFGGNAECPDGGFGYDLPFGLRWGVSRADVVALLGQPYEEDGEQYWADHRGAYVHPEYDGDQLVALEIAYDGWVPMAVSKWFETHPKATKGALHPGAAPAGNASDDTKPAAATLTCDCTSLTPGTRQTLQVEVLDDLLRGVPGQKLDLASSAGRVSDVTDLGEGRYSLTLWVPADASGTVNVSVATAGWGASATLDLPVSGASPSAGSLAAERDADPDGTSIYDSLAYEEPTAPAPAVPPPPPSRGKRSRKVDTTPSEPAVVTPAPSKPAKAAKASGKLPSIDNPARTGAKAPGSAAVVIGLEQYPFLGAGVPYAHRDAQAFDDLLIYTLGVPQQRIQMLSTGAREQMLTAIEKAANEAGNGGTVWVYFAGHGAANPQSGERMLLGDDVRSDAVAFASRGVGVSEIEKVVTAAGARPVLVLDTCFAGASRSGASILGGTRLVVPAYAIANTSSDAAQWNAASPDQISGPLPTVEHGAFTYYAVGALRGWADGELDEKRDGTVTAAEAQAYVTRALRRSGQNNQQPVYVGPDDLVLSTGVSEAGPAF